VNQVPHTDAATRSAVVTGGGTSGHVLPALAIIDRLVAAGYVREHLHYVGTEHGIETRLVPPTGTPFTLLDVVGLQRRLSWRTVTFVPKMMWATARAWRLLGRLQPGVVVNVGGYASMPATFAARLRRVPVVVVSYDQLPGLASRVAAKFAAAVAAAFADSPLPRARHTGAPVRPEIIAVDRARDRDAARHTLGLPLDRFVVGVFGGSLGAKVVNIAVAGMVDLWATRTDVFVYHVVGERWLNEVPSARTSPTGIMYAVIGYEDRMPALYAACDLMVTRGGASTIAELATTGTPAIVVPWPDAADDHQRGNARTLSDIGAAVLLEQDQLDAARLADEIDALIGHPERLAGIGAAAHVAGAVHRSSALIDLIDEVAR